MQENEKTKAASVHPIVMRWIPIAEQLPPIGDDVLFCCLIDDDFTRVDVGAYRGKATLGAAVAMQDSDDPHDWTPCSHWMPLPEPPQVPSA